MPESVVLSPLVSTERHSSESLPYCGSGEHAGRRVVERPGESRGVGARSTVGQLSFRAVGPTTGGPLCDGTECKAADVLLEGFRSPGMGSRCDVIQLGQSRQLRISAAQHDTQGASQNQGLQDESPPDRTTVATSSVVPAPTPPLGETPDSPTRPSRPLVSQDKGRVLHPRAQDLHLTAWRLSGIPSEHRDFLRTLPPWRPVRGDHPPSELIILDCLDSGSGAQSNKLVQLVHL